jgi:hypothetical protein
MKITAKQLAEELLKNPDDIVCSVSSNFELRGAVVPIAGIRLYRYKGELEKEEFTDAFDGGSYSKEVVRSNEEGSQNFVQL